MREWLIVDGYNVINSWTDFAKLRKDNLEHARDLLREKILEYAVFKGYSGLLVFDAQEVQGSGLLVFDAQEVQGSAEEENYGAVTVIYTDEGETADSWIERKTYELNKNGDKVFVVTSDYAEQINILGSGAYRISAREFKEEYKRAKKQIEEKVHATASGTGRNELGGRLHEHVRAHFEKLRRR